MGRARPLPRSLGNNPYSLSSSGSRFKAVWLILGVVTVFLVLVSIGSNPTQVSPSAVRGGVSRQAKAKPTRKELLKLKQNEFPISVTTEQAKAEWETILHPAEESMAQFLGQSTEKVMQMAVPKFWQAPVTLDGDLLTRAQAFAIGSRIEPLDSTIDTSNYRVEDTIDHIDLDINPFDHNGLLETIFVMIASYRDDQCPHTVESIMKRAHFPERIRIAIVDQRDANANDPSCIQPLEDCISNPQQALCQYKDRIDYFEMDAQYGVGPVFARHVGYRMYRGEYFAMQVDAHVFFVQNWDVMLVDQFKRTGNEMAVMTTYLSDIVGSIDPDTHQSLHEGRPIMCNTIFESDGRSHMYLRNDQQPESWPQITSTPQLAPYWAAGFSFGRGHFLVQVPYDQYLPMIFQGEEINIGLRGFSYGYDYYAPEFGVCFHMYANGINKAKRKKIKMFWENGSRYEGVEDHSYDRLLGLIDMNGPDVDPSTWNQVEREKYGLGKARPVTKFFDLYGIHLDTQTVEGHLCRFVSNSMHSMFVQHLRPNGMGIDYTNVSYKFVDTEN